MTEGPRWYVHQPTKIEACRWTREGRQGVLEWLTESGAYYRTSASDETELRLSPAAPFDLVVGTPQGPRPVHLGDMVIKGVGSKFYPVGDDVFGPSYRLLG
jgi:hypothetical protein